MPALRTRRALALALMVASGFSALGLQIVWTQQASLWLGQETAGVLAVVGAFFGGLATGAAALAPRIERSARPGRWYAGCELVVAAWALLLVALMPHATRLMLDLTGVEPGAARQWLVAFAGVYLLLLPATAAMGATLPAMERMLSSWTGGRSALGALYAGNTAGAVLGVLAAAFWLVPTWGLTRTAWVCAALSAGCAAVAWWLQSAAAVTTAAARSPASGRGLPVLAATGLLGIGYEVVAVRVISQVAENTVYTFALLLAAYLVGTAVGAAAFQRWLLGRHDGIVLRDRLLWALAWACLVGAAALWNAAALKSAVLQELGPSFLAALLAEAALALLAFLPATIVMGALFSHLCVQAAAAGSGFGRALACNTLGASLAPLAFGVLLLPWLGAKGALAVLVVGYLWLLSAPSWRRAAPWALAAGTGALALWAPPLRTVDVPEGGRIVAYEEGAMASVGVIEDARGVARLHINNRQQEGATDTLTADARQALLPLLLHESPQQALFLGLGTGATAWSAARDPSLQVTAVELLPEVIGVAPHFAQRFPDADAVARLRIAAADARRFVRAAPLRYDVIVSDNFHPARSGSGALYTVEHFAAVRERLAADGLFCQWLPLHQLDLESLRSIVASFVAVYPQGWAVLGTHGLDTPVIGLMARRDGLTLRHDSVRGRLADERVAALASPLGLIDEWAVWGSIVAGPTALAAWAAGARPNTDDRPTVTYSAPHLVYAADTQPRDRLLSLLRQVRADPAELVQPHDDANWTARVAAYWRARDRYLAAGRAVRPTTDAARMLAQVREPLLDVLRQSPDFTPAYDPLLRMALALADTDREAARTLLQQLARLQPARRDAALALARLPP